MKKRFWLSLPLSGAAMGLTVAFPQIGFLAFLLMAPALCWLFYMTGKENLPYRYLFLGGALYHFSFYFAAYHWFLWLYPMDFLGVTPGASVGIIAVCWLGLSLLQTVLSLPVMPLFAWLGRRTFLKRRRVLYPLLFAAQYTVLEWSQTFGWTGVPWARLSLSQIHYGLVLRSASLLGSYFITFCIVAVGGFAALVLLALLEDGNRVCRAHVCRVFRTVTVRFSLIAIAAILGVQLALGAIGNSQIHPEEGTPLVVAAVQGNVGSDLKWSADSREKTYAVYEKYTAEAAKAGASLVVFPETFMPNNLTPQNPLGKYVLRLATEYGVTVMCGAFYSDGEGNSYNAVFTAYPDGTLDETVYAKRHLVPFGEHVPWRPFIEVVFPVLDDIGMLSSDLTAGTDSNLFSTPYGKVGALICFDSIYEALARDSVRDGAELLVLPTNDSWFSDSRAAYMHHAQARLRAVESGRYIVRAADTGISSLIAPDGSVLEEQPPLTEGMALGTVYFSANTTPYMAIGNVFVYVLAALLALIPLWELCLLALKKSKKQDFI